METFARKALEFFLHLDSKYERPSAGFPGQVVNPFNKNAARKAVIRFYENFFSDTEKRLFVIGINPGRFGGGITGIPFTDPVALREICRIDNDLGERRELSSRFIYDVIENYGGVKKFYSQVFLTALYPLAIVRDGKNYNYYDDRNLLNHILPLLKSSFIKQTSFRAAENACICLGKKNYLYLKMINDELKYFNDIRILEHPRYIMQYKTKNMLHYREKYLKLLKELIPG